MGKYMLVLKENNASFLYNTLNDLYNDIKKYKFLAGKYKIYKVQEVL
jgi:hypothetical protein